MNYVWETELSSNYGVPTVWREEHHLKACLPKTYGSAFDYKITVAWVTKTGDRRWYCQFVNNNNDESRTFRSLKAAKAYATAIITLEDI